MCCQYCMATALNFSRRREGQRLFPLQLMTQHQFTSYRSQPKAHSAYVQSSILLKSRAKFPVSFLWSIRPLSNKQPGEGLRSYTLQHRPNLMITCQIYVLQSTGLESQDQLEAFGEQGCACSSCVHMCRVMQSPAFSQQHQNYVFFTMTVVGCCICKQNTLLLPQYWLLY